MRRAARAIAIITMGTAVIGTAGAGVGHRTADGVGVGHRTAWGRAASASAGNVRVTDRPVGQATSPRGRLAVGDSLLVGAESMLRPKGFQVHARVGRQFSVAPSIVRSHGPSLPHTIVIELGTNGPVQLADCRAVVRAAGPRRVVFLVTNRVPRPWQGPNNETLKRCDRGHRGPRVRIIDWYQYSADHPEWLASDGFHTSARGRRALADLIAAEVNRHG